jgi:hypothetical protein
MAAMPSPTASRCPLTRITPCAGAEIGVPEPSRRVGEGGSGKQGRAKDPGVGTDQQGLSILRISARQHDKGPSAIRFWEAAAVPARRPAALTGKQPDLEELKRVFAVIALQMADPGAGAHHLDVALYCPTDVAGAIFVCNDALADIGDDFHVCVRVTAETRAGRDLVVVPGHEGAAETTKWWRAFSQPRSPWSSVSLDRSCNMTDPGVRTRWGSVSGIAMTPKRSDD